MSTDVKELARPAIRERLAVIATCPVCEGDRLTRYLDLGSQPIANRLLTKPDDPSPRYPLGAQVCQSCGLSMLTHMVTSTELYKDYLFEAGASKQWHKHCEQLAKRIRPPDVDFPMVVDIGSNDGTLGKAFQREGWCVFGVEPNQPENTEASFPVKRAYWGTEEGDRARNYIRGYAPDVILATNVFSHAADPLDFLRGIKIAMRPTGLAVIECQHVGFMQQHWAFDTIYHEHLWFWWTKPMITACAKVGLEVVDLEYFPNLHTGSVRYWIRHVGQSKRPKREYKRRPKHAADLDRVAACLNNERDHLEELESYNGFAHVVVETVSEFRRIFTQADRPVLAGYGASAKAATMLNAIKATPEEILCVVDDTRSKQGKFLAGSRIPIVAEIPEETEVLILFSWNIAAGLIRKALDAEYKGMFLVPLPEMKLYGTESADKYARNSAHHGRTDKGQTPEIERKQEFIYA